MSYPFFGLNQIRGLSLHTHTAKPTRSYSFISSLPREGNINSELARLSLALSSLDTMIQTHVSSHYTDLLR